MNMVFNCAFVLMWSNNMGLVETIFVGHLTFMWAVGNHWLWLQNKFILALGIGHGSMQLDFCSVNLGECHHVG